MAKLSAGLLLFRDRNGCFEVLLVHPGGPFFRAKDAGAWTIPKGEPEEGEDLLETARREFSEEIGAAPEGPFIPLTPVKQRGGKIVHAWAVRGDCNPFAIKPNRFSLEWPPGSGRIREYPEIDYAAFFPLDEARVKINAAQAAFLDELTRLAGGERAAEPPPD